MALLGSTGFKVYTTLMSIATGIIPSLFLILHAYNTESVETCHVGLITPREYVYIMSSLNIIMSIATITAFVFCVSYTHGGDSFMGCLSMIGIWLVASVPVVVFTGIGIALNHCQSDKYVSYSIVLIYANCFWGFLNGRLSCDVWSSRPEPESTPDSAC